MAFRELDELLAPEPVVLPFNGKTYAFPGEISAKAWLQLQRISDTLNSVQRGEEIDQDDEVYSTEDQAGLMAEILGGVEQEMAADGCTSSQIKRAFYTLLAYHLNGRETAEAVWEAHAAGEAPAPNRTARRHPDAQPTAARSRGSRGGSTGRKA